MTDQPDSNLDRTLRDLEQHLLHLKEEGVRQIETDPRAPAASAGAMTPPAAPPLPPRSTIHDPPSTDTASGLAAIAQRIATCERCRLCKSRTRTVPGQGSTAPEIMFIGEGPGADEDAQGLAFVGRAGQLLTKIIEAMGLTRDQVFIGNIVKCRPPDNRTPLPDEMAACIPYLHEQIALLKPKFIVALGGTAMKGLFGETVGGITKLRGQWKTFQGIDVMPTYHPAYLLRNASGKRDVWEDMKTVLARLGRKPPSGKSG